MRTLIIPGAFFLLLGTGWQPLPADEYPPKTDNQVAALDLRTGNMVWAYKPKVLSDARFEVHPQGLLVYPHYASDNRSDPIYLDPARGEPINSFKPASDRCFALSAAFWPPPPITLDNGWELVGYSPGNTKTLRFRDPQAASAPRVSEPARLDPKQPARPSSANDVWTIPTGGYPHAVASWQNIVIYAFSYLSDEGVIYAYRAGDAKPQWTVDLNSIVRGRRQPLTRMRLQVIGNTLYAQANEHIFAFAPGSGRLHWHRDLCADLDLRFRPDLFGGVINLAALTEADDVLIVSFERRVIAYDLQQKQYLWHFEPDTFPHCPFPAVYDGRVFLTCGAKHRLHPAEE